MKPTSSAVAAIVGCWLQCVSLLAAKVHIRQEKAVETVFEEICSALDGTVESLASNEHLASLDRLASALVSLTTQIPSNREAIKTAAGKTILNIGSTLKPSLLRQHGEVNRTVSRALDKAKTCYETFSLGVEAANGLRDTLPSQRAALQHCHDSGRSMTSLLRASPQQPKACDELDKITNLMSAHVHNWGSQCDRRDDADVGAYLKQQAAYWEGLLHHYDTLDRLCQQSKEVSSVLELSQSGSPNPDSGHKAERDCGLLQMRMDSDSCTQALDRMQVCTAYDQCSTTWSAVVQQDCAEERRFMRAWSFLEHATCTLQSFLEERDSEDLKHSISRCKQRPHGSSAAMLLELPSCRRQEVPTHSSKIADCLALWSPGSDPNMSGTENYAEAYYQGFTPQRCNTSCCVDPPQPPSGSTFNVTSNVDSTGTSRTASVTSLVQAASTKGSIRKRCTSPLADVGYNYTDVQEINLEMGSTFSVSANCAPGYVGTAKALGCSHDGEAYKLVGCVGELCVAPLDTTGYVLTDISTERPSFNVTATCASGFTGHASVKECSGDLQDYVLQGCYRTVLLSTLQTVGSDKKFKLSESEPVTSNLPVTGLANILDVATNRNAKYCVSPEPEAYFNYTDIQEINLELGSNFNVLTKCSWGYTGTAMALGCSEDGGAYQLVGCTGEICTTPHDSTGYVITEIDIERPSFNVVASCAVGYDGTPIVEECPGDLKDYELHGCHVTNTSATLEKDVNCTNATVNLPNSDVYHSLCFHKDCGCPGVYEDFPESDGWCKMMNASARWEWHANMEASCGTSEDACNECDGRMCQSKRSIQLEEVAGLLKKIVHREPTVPGAFCFNKVCGCPGQLDNFPNSTVDWCVQGINKSKYRYHRPGWCQEFNTNCYLCHGTWCPTGSEMTSFDDSIH